MEYNRSEHQSEQINELVAAIVKAQVKMVPASKDHVNPYFKSKYADLPSCWEAVACFRDEGVAITQSPMEGPDGFILLDTQLSHISGQWMRSRLKIRVAKDDPQGYGSAITYARRYALGCMTGLVTEEDDDGNAASNPQPQAQRVMQNKAKAQAAINEVRGEGVAAESSRSAPAASAPADTLTPSSPTEPHIDERKDVTISSWRDIMTAISDDLDLAELRTIVQKQCGLANLMYPKMTAHDRIEFLQQFKQGAEANGLLSRVKALGL